MQETDSKVDLSTEIVETRRLDYCWVCTRKLPIGTPREEHHPLPQNAVGSAKFNPTVTICLDCHELVHDAIRKVKKNLTALNDFVWQRFECLDPHSDFLSVPTSTKIELRNARFLYLVQVAQRAEALTANNPNKRFIFSCRMSGNSHRKLVLVQKSWNVRSQEKLIEKLIDLAYNQTIIRTSCPDSRFPTSTKQG